MSDKAPATTTTQLARSAAPWRPPVKADGCLAAVPPQSAQSCEAVIEALALELTYAADSLDSIIEVYVHPFGTPEEVKDECIHVETLRDCWACLDALKQDWPHLPVWERLRRCRRTHQLELDLPSDTEQEGRP
jgi:hypothetical protein